MLRIHQLKIRTDHTEEQLQKKAAKALHIPETDIIGMDILRRSLDARKKPELFFCYTLDVRIKKEDKVLQELKGNGGKNQGNLRRRQNLQVEKVEPVKYAFPQCEAKARKLSHPPVIIGMGPAGLFCGYFLALAGYRPILLERGRDVETRMKDVETFWRTGRLDASSNVQFGEGGAGTFSDGKLNTLVKDKDGRNRAVLETFVKFGAKESVLYEAKPHIGTDVLAGIVKGMREEIIHLGGTVRFESRMTDICIEENKITSIMVNGQEKIPCEQLVLAIGHSARDTFFMLHDKKIPMEAKAFAVGFRVEHPQSMINFSQYGREEAGDLGAAAYKVTAKTSTGRGVYSFCMCPGGYVVNASSEEGYLAVNGMSYSSRDGKNANSAIIVSVTPKDYGSEHPLAGIAFQRKLEKKAYELGGGRIPAQRYGDFKRCAEGQARPAEILGENPDAASPEKASHNSDNKEWDSHAAEGEAFLQPQCKGDFTWADLTPILPKECNQAFVEGMEAFGRQIAGFNRPDAVLLGVESRTSSPVRINRNENLQSDIAGLYPCGEGAGYAGGITSAAMDGIRVAEAIARDMNCDENKDA
ncbi:MAG: FAD-dependent oxidoreductase [Lachnoclostridium sp.]|nr:FAD-dependent oxidoreductase [Lachnoclostridium sp.]MCM1383056.1 FAD-dependent oxidoreductase [Lachnoclostridium sp.]